MKYLLDTNVVSEFRKPQPNTAVIAWVARVNPATIYLSVITIGEIHSLLPVSCMVVLFSSHVTQQTLRLLASKC